MKDFNFKIPQNIQFGMGSLKKLPEILAENHSDNILLVSDRGRPPGPQSLPAAG